MSDFFEDEEIESVHMDAERREDLSHLWVVSYSDFMTILMIFFLMLFAHRVWSKKVSWEEKRQVQLRAAQESQKGMVQRLARLASVEMQAQRVDIHLPDALLFEAGQASLKDSAAALLGQISPELAAFKGEIVVEGHTDNTPVGSKGKFQSNWELSVGRAFSVIRFLQNNGVDPMHLSARGYGPYRPRVPNDTPENRAENRRIEIILLNPPNEAILKKS